MSLLSPRRQRLTPEDVSFRALESSDLELIFDRYNRPWGVGWLTRQARGEVFVAVACVDGLPVGRAGLDYAQAPTRRAAYLWAAHVEPEWRSRGVGTALFLHLERVALSRGLDAIELAVAKDNPRAHRLYEELGYTVYGDKVLSWAYQDDDGQEVRVEEDSWLMRKRLRGG